MAIDESDLDKLQRDTETELRIVSMRRSELKELYRQITTIRMTGRIEVTPAIPTIPAVMEEDKITIKTAAIPGTRETSEQVFDVQPIDRNLGGIPMDRTRRQSIYDSAVSKKAELGF